MLNIGLHFLNGLLKKKKTDEKNDEECYIVFIAAIFYHLIYFNNKLWAYDRQKVLCSTLCMVQNRANA